MELLILNSSSAHMQTSASGLLHLGAFSPQNDGAVNSLWQARVLHSCVKCGADAKRQRISPNTHAFL